MQKNMWDSPRALVDDYFSDTFESVVSLNLPLASASDYLRRVHKAQYIRPIREILSLAHAEKEKLLAPLVDFIASLDVSDPGVIADVFNKSKMKIKDDPEYGRIIEKIERYFNSLSPNQKFHVLNLATSKVLNTARSMRYSINRQITQVKNPSHFLLLDQIMYLVQESAIRLLTILRRTTKVSKITRSMETEFGLMLRALLRLEAVRRKRILLEEMMSDVSLLGLRTEPKHIVLREGMIKPILAALEG